jgi:excinuclease ABC subunit B
VILYADSYTDSMRAAIAETERRRERQRAYNAEHGIDPKTIRKAVTDLVAQFRGGDLGMARAGGSVGRGEGAPLPAGHRVNAGRSARAGKRAMAGLGIGTAGLAGEPGEMPADELNRLIEVLEAEMQTASAELRFEYAARLRDEVRSLRRELREVG